MTIKMSLRNAKECRILGIVYQVYVSCFKTCFKYCFKYFGEVYLTFDSYTNNAINPEICLVVKRQQMASPKVTFIIMQV